MLFFTGISRIASTVAKSKIENLHNKSTELNRMREMVDEGAAILENSGESIDRFGKLLHEAWRYKRSLSDGVSSPIIDNLYESAMSAGATGGKLLGAGGGGFFAIFAPPERQARIREALKDLIYVPINFDCDGSQIVFDKTDDS